MDVGRRWGRESPSVCPIPSRFIVDTLSRNPFLVRVAKDRLSATIEVRHDAELITISPDDAVAALDAASVAVDGQVSQRIEEYVAALRDPAGPPEGEYEIAAGRPATDGTDGTFTWGDSLQSRTVEWSEDEAADFYNVSTLVTVEAGTLIGWISPPQSGTDGVDVHGNRLPPTHTPREVVLKEGAWLGEDGKSVFAGVPGKIVYEDNELSVCDVVEIAGDVDFRTGNLDVASDLVIRGSIRDLFRVTTKKSLIVGGAIEGARVEAAGNVTVRGGILNRAKGRVVAGGEIAAKFCHEANLHARGVIRVSKGMINSHVYTESKLTVSCGAVIGGEVHAKHGVEARTLGSPANIATDVIVGQHPDGLPNMEAAATRSETRPATVARTRQNVARLLVEPKRPTAKHHKLVAPPTDQAERAQPDIDKSEKETTLAPGARAAEPYIMVTATIHGRVSITIDDRTVTFVKDMKGPIKIERREIDHQLAIVAVNQLTGSVYELPTQEPESRTAVAEAD